jgi:hypothetical protein
MNLFLNLFETLSKFWTLIGVTTSDMNIVRKLLERVSHFGPIHRKSGRMTQAVSMLEKCVWLQPRFVQAYVELLTLKTESEKQGILTKLIDLEPNNWEHFVLFGDWYKTRGK